MKIRVVVSVYEIKNGVKGEGSHTNRDRIDYGLIKDIDDPSVIEETSKNMGAVIQKSAEVMAEKMRLKKR